MTDTFIYKNERPWPNERLTTAAIVGHTTADSARLWFRTGGKGSFSVLVYAAEQDSGDDLFKGFKAVPYRALDTLPGFVRRIDFDVTGFETDTTQVIDLEGLDADTEYRFALYGEDQAGNGRILLGQDELGKGRRYRFRTMLPPEEQAKSALSFGLYSCHMPYEKTLFGGTSVCNMEMWECLQQVLDRHHASDLRFLIAGGDQVYTDGIGTLDIWKYLNKVMRVEDGELLPTQETMLSWYRDIYRGYWGFQSLRRVFGSYPTYMIWDDHEMGDGWGSFYLDGADPDRDEIDEIFPSRADRMLTRDDCLELLRRMGEAGKQVYREYEHSHNPPTQNGIYDYAFTQGHCAFYVLDGRGNRDINRESHKILGSDQLARFGDWCAGLDVERTPYVFVVSAVPVIHMSPALVGADDTVVSDMLDLQDDLRDAWEHHEHDQERRELLAMLFGLAQSGAKVSILSGDVHISAVFRMTEPVTQATIHQLTSSAITYHKPRLISWLLKQGVPDEGDSEDGYHFERLALFSDTNFGLVKVDPQKDEVVFQLYGRQALNHPDQPGIAVPMTHSIAKIKMAFGRR